jgi:predicted DNA repair protein MutK
MLSLFSTLGGLLISGLPKLLDFFQNKDDQKHELALARVQVELQLQMMAQGFKAQERMEEIRTDQIAMQTDAQMTEAALKHGKGKHLGSQLCRYCKTNRDLHLYI